MTDLIKTENEELIRCSRCKCLKKKSLYSVRENTGKLLKTCTNCRTKNKCEYKDCNYSCGSKNDLVKHKKKHDK